MFVKRGKRGQVTIFIIVAILVVALAVLIYFLFPKIKSSVSTQAQTPSEYIDICMKEKVVSTVEKTSLSGGTYKPSKEDSYFYLNENNNKVADVQYLCYTNQYYLTCGIQIPMLYQHMESEIKNEISSDVNSCFKSMVESYKGKGYDVVLKNPTTETKVEILPERIVVSFDNELTLTKGESQNYDDFKIVLESNLYQMTRIAISVVDWESIYGDAPVQTYMDWYHNLKIEKKLQLDGTAIYIITDRNTEEVFQFASRSIVIPPGY